MKLSNYSKIFKALSNPQRLKIFLTIYNQCCGVAMPLCSSVINRNKCLENQNKAVEKAFTKACKCIKLSRSTISHHFKELQNAGLIKCSRNGQTFRCTINNKAIKAINELFK